MSTYKTQGIVIKRNNFHESSLILDIYTKDYGKVEAVARSARKEKGKLKGHLEIFLYSEFIFAHGRNIDTITSSLTVESFANIRRDLALLYAASYIIEITEKMTAEGHSDERIFYLLKKSLCELDKLPETLRCKTGNKNGISNEGSNRRDLIVFLYQMHLINLAGFSPELARCVFCSKTIMPGKNYFSFKLGGVIGGECVKNDPEAASVSDNAIKLMRLFGFGENNAENYVFGLDRHFDIVKKLKIDSKLVCSAIFLMDKFIEFNIDRDIKSVDFLGAI